MKSKVKAFTVAKWLLPLLLGVAGLGMFASGLLYGALAVGVPTPDAPPEVAAREARHVAISGSVMTAGLVLAAGGLAGLTLTAVVEAARRHKSEAHES